MGRKRNYSTEQLIVFIDEYFSQIKAKGINIGRITAEGIARYFKNNGRELDLEGYHFRLDSEAMEHIERNLKELNELVGSTIPIGDIFIWRTFRANEFYEHHKNETFCGLHIIGEYLNNACSLIDKQNKVILGLQKQTNNIKNQLKEKDNIILGKSFTSDNHYAKLVKEKQKYNELKEKYDELLFNRKIDEEASKMAVLSDMHVIPIRQAPNTYAKSHSYLGEPEKRTPSLNEILNRHQQVDEQKVQETDEPYWTGLVDDNGEK